MVAPDFNAMMADLLMIYGDTVNVYKHKGYDSEDEFWQDDQGWETTSTEHDGLIEESISQETLEQAGFEQDAETAIWFDNDAVETGDLVEHQETKWIVIQVDNFHVHNTLQRQIAGLRETNE